MFVSVVACLGVEIDMTFAAMHESVPAPFVHDVMSDLSLLSGL
jgi:hypothetical protein